MKKNLGTILAVTAGMLFSVALADDTIKAKKIERTTVYQEGKFTVKKEDKIRRGRITGLLGLEHVIESKYAIKDEGEGDKQQYTVMFFDELFGTGYHKLKIYLPWELSGDSEEFVLTEFVPVETDMIRIVTPDKVYKIDFGDKDKIVYKENKPYKG